MDIQQFKKTFDPVLEEFVNKKTAEFIKLTNDPFIKNYVSYSKNLITGEGKRIRPYLAYLSYKTFGGKNENKIMNVFVALELFHNFLLIHDDIIDKSIVRRGHVTIHEYIYDKLKQKKRTGDLKHIANSQTIVIGDIIFSWALELLYGLKNGNMPHVLNYFFKTASEVIMGQIIDVDTSTRENAEIKLIEEKTTLKTAYYTFIRPLQIGAVLANADYGMEKFFEEFGMKLGIAFQVQDDLLDIIGSPDKIKKTPLLDIAEHQQTFFTNYLLEHGTKEQKKYFISIFGKQIDKKEFKKIRDLFVNSGAISDGKRIIDDNYRAAKIIIKNSKFDDSIKNRFLEIMLLLENRNH